MNRKSFAVAGISVLCAVVLGSALTTASAAGTRSRIKIDTYLSGIEGGTGKFVLTLKSALDGGTITFTRSFGADKTTAEGLPYSVLTDTETLKGKAGTLVIRSSGQAFAPGFGDEVWMGTWTIVKGTGQYAGLTGGGRWVANEDRSHHAIAGLYAGLVG